MGLFGGIFRFKLVWLYSSFTFIPVLRQQWNDAALFPSRLQNKTSFCSVRAKKVITNRCLWWQQIPTNLIQMQAEVSAGKDDRDEQGQTASHACTTMKLSDSTSPSHSEQCTGTVLSYALHSSCFTGLLRNLSLSTVWSAFRRLCAILKGQHKWLGSPRKAQQELSEI